MRKNTRKKNNPFTTRERWSVSDVRIALETIATMPASAPPLAWPDIYAFLTPSDDKGSVMMIMLESDEKTGGEEGVR